MLRGRQGQKRSADVIGAEVQVVRIATSGEEERQLFLLSRPQADSDPTPGHCATRCRGTLGGEG